MEIEEEQIVILREFKQYPIHYYKSISRGYDKQFDRIEYEAKGQKSIFLTYNNNFHEILRYDERGFNTMYILVIQNIDKDLFKLASYIYKYFEKLKASDPLYGTYSHINRNYFAEGKKNLYLHDIFDYIKKQDRLEKLNSIFK